MFMAASCSSAHMLRAFSRRFRLSSRSVLDLLFRRSFARCAKAHFSQQTAADLRRKDKLSALTNEAWGEERREGTEAIKHLPVPLLRRLAVSDFVHIHVLLRVRNAYAVGVKREFDFFQEVSAYRPVVTAVYPGANVEVNAAIGKLANCDSRRRVGEDAVVLFHDVIHDLLGFSDVIVIAYAKHQVDAPGGFSRVVGNGAAIDLAIGYDDLPVITGFHNGGKYADFLDHAGSAAGFDEVAYLERAEQDDHYARGKV